jgi:L-histidine N-alpha-methyltransferase
MDNGARLAVSPEKRFRITRLGTIDQLASLARDATAGLQASPKRLPPKYFYDERGSLLYDRICEVPEYYPARTESALLAAAARQIITASRPDTLFELGSGTSRKTEHLLNACEELGRAVVYQPLDVCEEVVRDAGTRLLDEYDWLSIDGIVGDYAHGLENVTHGGGRRLFVFLGGTLGNLTDLEAQRFLKRIRHAMGSGDHLLLGVDRVKDHSVLNAAYNDRQGVTAQFNLNVLHVLNRELGAKFDPSRFRHRAWFNEAASQIEMHLESCCAQRVRIEDLGMEVDFAQGETIHTEISRKFTEASIRQLIHQAGLELREHFEPENRYFSLLLLGRRA